MLMPMPFISTGATYVLTLVAATIGSNEGYSDGSLSTTPGGSITPDVTENGSLVAILVWNGTQNLLAVAEAEPPLSTIKIDGASYAMTFVLTSSGEDVYAFSPGTQVIFSGNTYSVELS